MSILGFKYSKKEIIKDAEINLLQSIVHETSWNYYKFASIIQLNQKQGKQNQKCVFNCETFLVLRVKLEFHSIV